MTPENRELFKRFLGALEKPRFEITQFCFDKQLSFVEDATQYKTAVCSRRAGKTIACAADLTATALSMPDVVCLYITLSRKNAKRIVWPELLKLNREFQLGGKPNETDLSIRYPNGSMVYCSGAKDKSEIENFRGLPLKKVYVDECQSFRAHIADLIDDVLSKALFDYAGTLCLIGTPGLVPAGYFYDCTQSDAWSHHAWTMFDNPHLPIKSGKSIQEMIDADCKRMGVDISHPKIQRECFGKWAVDRDSLIFRYNAEINDFKELPNVEWQTVMGVDLGHDDADAIAVLGWHKHLKELYLIEEFTARKQGITELSDQIEERVKKYEPLKIKMDTGALGKKIAEEMRRRRGIPIEAAEKARKMEFIELLNDSMRTGQFRARQKGLFAQDCFLVEKDRDKSGPEKIVISDKYHSDICDAVLYAYREALHWLETPAPKVIQTGSDEWKREQERQMEREAESRLERQSADEWEFAG